MESQILPREVSKEFAYTADWQRMGCENGFIYIYHGAWIWDDMIHVNIHRYDLRICIYIYIYHGAWIWDDMIHVNIHRYDLRICIYIYHGAWIWDDMIHVNIHRYDIKISIWANLCIFCCILLTVGHHFFSVIGGRFWDGSASELFLVSGSCSKSTCRNSTSYWTCCKTTFNTILAAAQSSSKCHNKCYLLKLATSRGENTEQNHSHGAE